MADNPQMYGFRYHGSRVGMDYKPERVRVASGYQGADVNAASCNLNVGDVVKKVSDGTVALAAGTDAFFGVIVNILPYYDGSKMRWNKFLPGNTVYGTVLERQSFVEIVPVAGYLFEVDINATNASWDTQAEFNAFIGENVNHINTGDTVNVSANPQLNISGHATTNTLQWRITDVSPTLMNQDFSGNYVKLIVTANISQQAAGGAGTLTGV